MNRARGWASPQRHRPLRRPQLAQLLSLLCAAAALGLAGCGSTHPASISTSTPTPTGTPAEIATPTPTAEPTDAAILNAYDQASAAWVAAAEVPNPQYPGILQWYTGDSLTIVAGELSELQSRGWALVGTYTPHPVVTSVKASTATVQVCAWDTTYIVEKATSTPVSPQPWGGTTTAGWDTSTATMVLQSGAWLLSQQLSEGIGESTPCMSASPSP